MSGMDTDATTDGEVTSSVDSEDVKAVENKMDSENSRSGDNSADILPVVIATSDSKGDSEAPEAIESAETTVGRLYQLCELLDAALLKGNLDQHTKLFDEIIQGVRGGEKAQKQLACQFITRFFSYFPDSLPRVLDALFDLCEDEDSTLRRSAIKELPAVCKQFPSAVSQISDVLAQLLQADDTVEYAVVQSSLLHCLKIQPKECIGALFGQICAGSGGSGEEVVRERAIKFLVTKLPSLGVDIMTPELETLLIQHIQHVMQDCSGEEFSLLVKVLSTLKCMQQTDGRNKLIAVIARQAQISGSDVVDLNIDDEERLAVLSACSHHALNFASKSCMTNNFVQFFCLQVLPKLKLLPEEEGKGPLSQLDALRLTADLSTFTNNSVPVSCLEQVHSTLTQLLPSAASPAKQNEESADKDQISSQKTDEDDTQNLQLSHLECLLYTLHCLGRHHPNFLSQDETRLKQLRQSLQRLSSGLQTYIRKLREDIAEKNQQELKLPESKVKVMALKVTLNITGLVKDITRIPTPCYDSNIILSWKPRGNSGHAAGSGSYKQKRRAPDDSSRQGRQVYNPPSGKYSRQMNSYDTQYKPGFRGNRNKLGVYYA